MNEPERHYGGTSQHLWQIDVLDRCHVRLFWDGVLVQTFPSLTAAVFYLNAEFTGTNP